MKFVAIPLFFLGFLSIFISPVFAQFAISDCNVTLQTSGVYELTTDISLNPADTVCINVNISDVTIDTLGFNITGHQEVTTLGIGTDESTVGIRDSVGTTNIQNFTSGISYLSRIDVNNITKVITFGQISDVTIRDNVLGVSLATLEGVNRLNSVTVTNLITVGNDYGLVFFNVSDVSARGITSTDINAGLLCADSTYSIRESVFLTTNLVKWGIAMQNCDTSFIANNTINGTQFSMILTQQSDNNNIRFNVFDDSEPLLLGASTTGNLACLNIGAEQDDGDNTINKLFCVVPTVTEEVIPFAPPNQTDTIPFFNETEFTEAGIGFILPFFSPFILSTLIALFISAVVGRFAGSNVAVASLLIFISAFVILQIYPIWMGLVLIILAGAFFGKAIQGFFTSGGG